MSAAAARAIAKFRFHELKGLESHIARHGPLPPKEPTSTAQGIRLPNPFLPHRNPKTGRWAPPKYSLRRQAELIKKAKETNTLHLLPPGPKLHEPQVLAEVLRAKAGQESQTESEKAPELPEKLKLLAFEVDWVGKFMPEQKGEGAQRVPLYAEKKRMFKGHKWERTKDKREAHRAMLLRDMDKRIRSYKGEKETRPAQTTEETFWQTTILDYRTLQYYYRLILILRQPGVGGPYMILDPDAKAEINYASSVDRTPRYTFRSPFAKRQHRLTAGLKSIFALLDERCLSFNFERLMADVDSRLGLSKRCGAEAKGTYKRLVHFQNYITTLSSVMTRILATAILAANVTVTYAQSTGSSFSESCTNALNGISSDPTLQRCLPFADLMPLLSENMSTPIIPPIDSWLGNMCSAPACPNETLSSLVNTLFTGCESDIREVAGGSTFPDSPDGIIQGVQDAYGTVRKILCLQSGDTKCVTDILNTFEDMDTDGILTLGDTPALLTRFLGGQPDTDNGIPQNVTCSACTKAAFITAEEDYPGIWGTESEGLKGTMQGICGSEFVDGQRPDNVTQTANNAVAEPESGPEGQDGNGGEGNSASRIYVYAGIGPHAALAIGAILAVL
ncbi:hypothetical protein VNI00_017809 [Paramarasmius palmivorus]|uniref:Large ribosomal subunit protein mL59 domain-containing protein n=1 Tax=Paramarasmius palmivorus TaxID=297713 RepID=A0AAW0B2M9_9AGAR